MMAFCLVSTVHFNKIRMKKGKSKKNVKAEQAILFEDDNYILQIEGDTNGFDINAFGKKIKAMMKHSEELQRELEEHERMEAEEQERTEKSMLEYEMELQRELEEWERRQAAKQSRMMEYNEESESNTLMMDDDYDDTCYYNEDYDPFDPWNNIDTSIAVLFDESMDDYGGDADLFFDAHDDYFD